MPSIDKLRHNIRHAVSLSAFSPNLIHRIRYFFSLYSYFPRLLHISGSIQIRIHIRHYNKAIICKDFSCFDGFCIIRQKIF